MKIGIIGTRGIPNHYGGFEQFAEYLSKGLVKEGFDVTVYNSHTHPYQHLEWNGVKIVHCQDPENKIGTAGQFIYDLNCILDSRKRDFDIILQLGYTSSTVWGWLLPRSKSIIATNMDGLEWKRTKYSKLSRKFIKYAEKLGVKYSDYLISDSVGIREYLQEKYQVKATYIPYGANVMEYSNTDVLKKYRLEAYNYNMLVARLEPENSIEVILDGVFESSKALQFLVIGNHNTTYGEYLKKKYATCDGIKFLGGIYNQNDLDNLRYYSNLYFHGHTVGGTNPSLLEAMASGSLICAHRNIFNSSILEKDAFYFSNVNEVKALLNRATHSFKLTEENQQMLSNNMDKISQQFSWERIIQQYINYFGKIMAAKSPYSTRVKELDMANI